MAKTNNGLVAVAVVLGITALTPAASARDQLRIVGSSTVYPFTTAVAEQFGKATGARTPVIESTGTGGGMKIFCEGIGVDKVDVTNASRRMKKGEFDACQKNGVTEIIEVNIGFDGLTMAQSKTGAPMKLTLAQVFLALAEQVPTADGKLVANPHKLWSDIDRSLPNHKIEILGPPPTSGTRDSLHELFLEKGAEQIPELKALKSADPKACEKIWKSIRRDGAYVEAGENDNVIVQKLEINKDALGVFGYSFLEENAAKLRGVAIDNADPSFENIANGKYKGARRMYVYFKKQHFGVIPGLDKFMAQYVSEKTLGQDGALARKGLVPLPKAEFEAMRKAALAGETTKADALTN